MVPKVLLCAAVATFTLGACSLLSTSDTDPPVAARVECGPAGGKHDKPVKCPNVTVTATVSGSTCKVTDIPEVVLQTIPPSNPDRVARIVWQLPPGFYFCRGDGGGAGDGDGVFVDKQGDDGQFVEAHQTSDPDGGEATGFPGRCRPYYRLHDKNELHTATRAYNYTIKFHRGGLDISCKLDPLIRNG